MAPPPARPYVPGAVPPGRGHSVRPADRRLWWGFFAQVPRRSPLREPPGPIRPLPASACRRGQRRHHAYDRSTRSPAPPLSMIQFPPPSNGQDKQLTDTRPSRTAQPPSAESAPVARERSVALGGGPVCLLAGQQRETGPPVPYGDSADLGQWGAGSETSKNFSQWSLL